MSKLPKGFKKMPITGKNLKTLKNAWSMPDDEFCTDRKVWNDIIKEEFDPPVTRPTMEHVMAWVEAGP